MKNSSSILIWIGLVIIASLGLYRTSDRVNELTQNLSQINSSIEAERQSIHVLKADWVYLANPERVEKVAKRHLALRPTVPEQVTAMKDLSEILPAANEQIASVIVNSAPLSTIKSSFKTRLATTTHAIESHIAVIHLASGHKPSMPVVAPSSETNVLTANDSGHLNDHMIMQRTASAQPMPDSIGAMINGMDSHP